MKRLTAFAGMAALFILLSSGRCKNGNNDLLVKLYNRSYTSMTPLKTTHEPVYKPLTGCWNLVDDRPLMITEKDPNTYEFRFLSPYLGQDDVVYPAYVTTIGKNRYLNMQGYREQFMFFKIGKTDENGVLPLQMITAEVEARFKGGNLYQYLASHPNVPDTSEIWYSLALLKISEADAYTMQREKLKRQVSDLGDYDKYRERFPDDTALARLKNKAIDYSVRNASSVKAILEIRDQYPEAAPLISRTARKKCTEPTWCVDYVMAFPDDPAKDSILDVAFAKADSKDEYYYLVKNVPSHREAGHMVFLLASEVYSESLSEDSEKKYTTRYETKYEDVPAVMTMVNTIRLFENAELNENAFLKNSYLLSQQGRDDLDRLVQLALSNNKDSRAIQDLYVMVAMNDDYNANAARSNFLQSANKAYAVKKYLESKSNGQIVMHCIPVGAQTITGNNKDRVRFSLRARTGKEWQNMFYDQCFTTGQTDIVPDGKKEPVQNAFIRVPEVENKIIRDFEKQVAAYKNKQAFSQVIPPNYWNAAGKSAQPGFDEFQLRLKAAAKESKLKSKRIPLFVIP